MLECPVAGEVPASAGGRRAHPSRATRAASRLGETGNLYAQQHQIGTRLTRPGECAGRWHRAAQRCAAQMNGGHGAAFARTSRRTESGLSACFTLFLSWQRRGVVVSAGCTSATIIATPVYRPTAASARSAGVVEARCAAARTVRRRRGGRAPAHRPAPSPRSKSRRATGRRRRAARVSAICSGDSPMRAEMRADMQPRIRSRCRRPRRRAGSPPRAAHGRSQRRSSRPVGPIKRLSTRKSNSPSLRATARNSTGGVIVGGSSRHAQRSARAAVTVLRAAQCGSRDSSSASRTVAR